MDSCVRSAAPVAAVCLLLLAGLTACDEAPASATAEPVAPEVSFVTMHAGPRPVVRELPGRIAPMRIAEVRARVSGIVTERAFSQGTDVKAGDVLYRIDPVPFEVELQAAQAAHDKAKAAFELAEQQAKRMETLVAEKAVSRVQFETATSEMQQARADVAARAADVRRARLNLEYATVRSPINGRVGRALVTEGALVGQGDPQGYGDPRHRGWRHDLRLCHLRPESRAQSGSEGRDLRDLSAAGISGHRARYAAVPGSAQGTGAFRL